MMRSRNWLGAAAIAAAVAAVGLVELAQVPLRPLGSSALAAFAFLAWLGIAVGAARWAPGIALGAAWAAAWTQLLGGVPVLLTEIALVVVLFAAARWGHTVTVVLAAFSIGLTPVLALVWVRRVGIQTGLGGDLLIDLLGAAGATAREWRLLLLGLTVLGIPFLSGLALRFLSRARTAQAARQTAERDARQAQEIARLQEAQNRLARDVHDVVGHSLTVILAQAESAQFIEDPDRLKQTMQTIATSARTSLQDVRHVLTPGQESTAGGAGGLDALIETVHTSDRPMVSTQVGPARPLPPELNTVAYRVLQEMLTNAIKHGRRDRPVHVERRWPELDVPRSALRIEVRNTIDVSPPEDPVGGQGLAGIRRRLESVGGSFEAYRTEEPDGPTFTAVAFVPVRSAPVGGPT
jgi:signal transduction histidine kinase